MDKKGIILYTILRLLVGSAVLLLLFAIIFNISMIFLSPEVSQGTSESFNDLVTTANRLAANDPGLKSTIVQYDIDNPLVLFGFTYPAQPVVIEKCTLIGSNAVSIPSGKPPQGCDNKPCFCICDEDDNCKDPVECRILNETIKTIKVKEGINSQSLGDKYGGGFQYIAFFGKCGTFGGEWELTALKLEFDRQSGELVIST